MHPLIAGPGEAPSLQLGGFDIVYLAKGAQTGGAYTLLETVESTVAVGPPMHAHLDATETFYVVEGEYVFHVGEESRICPAGSLVVVPPGVPHTFQSRVAPSRKLNLFTPAAMEGYFEELAAARERGATDADVEAIAERYSMKVLGPAPEGYL